MFNLEELEQEMVQKAGSLAPRDTVRALFSHRWVTMAVFLFFVGAFFENTILMSLTGFMLMVTVTSWLWSRAALDRVLYTRRFQHRRAFPGETIGLELLVENRKLLPLAWVQIDDAWAMDFGPADDAMLVRTRPDRTATLVNGYTLRWNQRVRRRYELVARRRGIYQIGPAVALSGDPFSLFERERAISKGERLIVYPEVHSLEELGLPVKDPLGDFRTQQQLFEDPNRIMGVREYQPQDSMRHVHWKATARTHELQTKVYEPTRSISVVLCLNVATFEQHWRGIWPEMLEYLVSTAASLAYWGSERNYAMGLVANGTLAHADQPFRIMPSQDRDHLTRLLETLAGVSFFVTADFAAFLREESPRLPWGATLVIITSYLNDVVLSSILRLRDSGRRLVVLMLGKAEPPDIPGVLVHHLPIAGEEPDLDALDAAETVAESADAEEKLTPRQRFLRERAREERDRRQGDAS